MKLIWILVFASSVFATMKTHTSSLPQIEKDSNKDNETTASKGVTSPLVAALMKNQTSPLTQIMKERSKVKEEVGNRTRRLLQIVTDRNKDNATTTSKEGAVNLPQIVKEINKYKETTVLGKGAANIRDILNSMDSIEQEIIDLGIASGEQLRYRRKISNDVMYSNKVINVRKLKKLVRLKYAGKRTKKFINGPIKRQKKQTKRKTACFNGQVEWKKGLCMPCSLYYEMSDGAICTSQQFKDACFLKWHEECDIM